MWHALMELINKNQVAAGGIVLMGLGAIIALLRSVPEKIWSAISGHLITRVQVTSDSDVYYGFHLWLALHPYTQRSRNVYVVTERHSGMTSIILGSGEHFLWMRGRPVWISIMRERLESQSMSSSLFVSTLSIRAMGVSRAWVNGVVEEVKTLIRERNRELPKVYIRDNWGEEWIGRPEIQLRALDSLVYEPDTIRDVVADAKRFLANEARYRDLGVPYRRGYLLFGPPGTGKTSLATALAHELQRDLYIMPLGSKKIDDERLMSLLANLPSRSVLLVEDIDAAFHGREKANESDLTFSGLLNALDGVTARTGIVTILTTNHREKLDPALIRPGRMDVHVKLDVATHSQASRIFARFHPAEHSDVAHAFGFHGAGCSMAQLQEVLMRHDENPGAALAAVQTIARVAA